MSRAFVKETDGAEADAQDVLPDRPISPHRNLVTPRGLRLIEAALARLQAEHAAAVEKEDRGAAARVARDLRYWQARRGSAEVVDNREGQAAGTEGARVLRFGMKATVEREDGRRQTFRIVGEDEAEPSAGRVSWVAPLPRALIGLSEGEAVEIDGEEVFLAAVDPTPEDQEPEGEGTPP